MSNQMFEIGYWDHIYLWSYDLSAVI